MGAAELGAVLRGARIARGVSLAELHARTKISTAHLVALEEGRLDALPPLAFTRGFLRTVAGELGMDPEPLVRSLNAAMSADEAEGLEGWRRVGAAVVPARSMSPMRRRIVFIVLAAFLVVLAALALLTRQLWEFAQPVAPAALPAVVATPPAPEAPPASGPALVPPEAQTPPTAGPSDRDVTVEVRASGRSWLLVQSGTEVLFRGFINAGQAMRWQSRAPISLRAGNAGAITVLVNGSSLGTYGRLGEVVDRTFEPGPLP